MASATQGPSLALPFAESFDSTHVAHDNSHLPIFECDDTDFPALNHLWEWQLIHRHEASTELETKHRSFAEVAASAGSLNQPFAISQFVSGLGRQHRQQRKSGSQATSERTAYDEALFDASHVYAVRKGMVADKRRSSKGVQHRQRKVDAMRMQQYVRAMGKHLDGVAIQRHMHMAALAEAEKHAMEKRELISDECKLYCYGGWWITMARQRDLAKLVLEAADEIGFLRSYRHCRSDEEIITFVPSVLRNAVLKLKYQQPDRYYYLFGERHYPDPTSGAHRWIATNEDRWDYLEHTLHSRLAPQRRDIDQCKNTLANLEDNTIRHAVSTLPKYHPSSGFRRMHKAKYARLFVTKQQ